MPVFKLKPIDLDHPDWECSTHKEECLVYAETEDQARDVATFQFKIATAKKVGAEVPRSPWRNPDLVESVEIADMTPEVTAGAKGMVLHPRDER